MHKHQSKAVLHADLQFRDYDPATTPDGDDVSMQADRRLLDALHTNLHQQLVVHRCEMYSFPYPVPSGLDSLVRYIETTEQDCLRLNGGFAI